MGGLGAFAGLMGNVYYPNVILLIFPALETIHLVRERQRGPDRASLPFLKLVSCSIVFGAVFLVTLLPTFVTRQIIYGSPLKRDTREFGPGIGFSCILARSISADHGLLSWTPILSLRLSGFFPSQRNPLLGAGSILTFWPTIIL